MFSFVRSVSGTAAHGSAAEGPAAAGSPAVAMAASALAAAARASAASFATSSAAAVESDGLSRMAVSRVRMVLSAASLNAPAVSPSRSAFRSANFLPEMSMAALVASAALSFLSGPAIGAGVAPARRVLAREAGMLQFAVVPFVPWRVPQRSP